jgi:hypothetical protein
MNTSHSKSQNLSFKKLYHFTAAYWKIYFYLNYIFLVFLYIQIVALSISELWFFSYQFREQTLCFFLNNKVSRFFKIDIFNNSNNFIKHFPLIFANSFFPNKSITIVIHIDFSTINKYIFK